MRAFLVGNLNSKICACVISRRFLWTTDLKSTVLKPGALWFVTVNRESDHSLARVTTLWLACGWVLQNQLYIWNCTRAANRFSMGKSNGLEHYCHQIPCCSTWSNNAKPRGLISDILSSFADPTDSQGSISQQQHIQKKLWNWGEQILHPTQLRLVIKPGMERNGTKRNGKDRQSVQTAELEPAS